MTCVSLPPSQRRAPFRGIHKGYSPYVCFLSCFLHKQKTSRPPGRDRASCAARGTLIKKARCCAAAQKEPLPRTGPGILCRSRHTDQKGKVLRSWIKKPPARTCVLRQAVEKCNVRYNQMARRQLFGRFRACGGFCRKRPLQAVLLRTRWPRGCLVRQRVFPPPENKGRFSGALAGCKNAGCMRGASLRNLDGCEVI